MKCINKKYRLIIALAFISTMILSGCKKEELNITSFETQQYDRNLYQGKLFAPDLCVSLPVADEEAEALLSAVDGAGLFDLKNKQILFADNIHDVVYPASTTKIMTAIVALQYGNLDDIVTVSENADAGSFSYDAQVCGLKEGDQLTLRDLLYGLILYSGNDTAVAIAEHISGDVDTFCELMNEQAARLQATHTHFTNPHGLHDDDHYTTAYDLYLMFNHAITDADFMAMIEATSYNMQITHADGEQEEIECLPTNYYSANKVNQPEAATVIGGKTGTTGEAGSCVVLYSVDTGGNPYISVVMGAANKDLLYADMTRMINLIGATP